MLTEEKRTRPAVVIAGLLIIVATCLSRSVLRSAARSLFPPEIEEGAAARALPVESEELTLPRFTVAERVRQYGDLVRARLEPRFLRAGVPYPPAALSFVALKQEKTLEVYAADQPEGPFRFVCSYSMQAASGGPGPKFAEGDLQVPEGMYRVESLNPNSLFHLSLRVNYPNEFDRAKAQAAHRTNLGGDIMIHGGAASVGCLAMGDPAAEDLFVLAAITGIEKIRLVFSPLDFRTADASFLPTAAPDWLPDLYAQLRTELRRYPRPELVQTLP